MTREALLAEILKLPHDQRLELVEQVLIESEPVDDETIPEWHKAELDRRLNDPTDAANIPWEEARKRLGIPPK